MFLIQTSTFVTMKVIMLFLSILVMTSCKTKVNNGTTGNYQVVTDLEKMDIHVLMMPTKKQAKPNRTYSSYFNNKIHCTTGNNSGKILHGDYKAFYLTGEMKSVGKYKYGLKNGNWIHYYKNGKIQSRLKYHNSDTLKHAILFSNTGQISDTIFTQKSRIEQLEKNKPSFFSKFKKEKNSEQNIQTVDSLKKVD